MRICSIDLEQAESRVVGAICLRLFGDSTYLDAVEAGDIHSYVAKMVNPSLDWPENFTLDFLYENKLSVFPKEVRAAAKKVADGTPLYRDKSLRACVKTLGHGSNYMGQPKTMSANSHLPVKLVADFQKTYFDTFPAIRRWHEWVRIEIQQHRALTTMLGRRCLFLSDVYSAETHRKAVAYEPQSVATGDYISIGIEKVRRAGLPLFLLSQVHDSLVFEYDHRDENWIVPEVQRLLQIEIKLTPHEKQLETLLSEPVLTKTEKLDLARLKALQENPRAFSIPNEAKVGWNLAPRTEQNPNGLVKFPDTSGRKFVR